MQSLQLRIHNNLTRALNQTQLQIATIYIFFIVIIILKEKNSIDLRLYAANGMN